MSNSKNDYFSLAVKTRKQDLFDREAELKALQESLNDPLTVVAGIRRLGKSSLVTVALNETKSPSLIIDLRGVGPNPSPLRVLQRFETGVNELKSKRLWEDLSKISGVSLFSFGVQFSKSNKTRPTIQSLLDSIENHAQEIGKRFVIAIDEVQEARGLGELTAAFAHSYDYNKNVRLVLAGSEVGVLHDFVGLDDPQGHLYGRKINFVELKSFSKETSLEFLKKGFEAYRKKVQSSQIEEAVNKLDGIVGWLVLYGHDLISGKPNLQGIVNQAVRLVESESSKIVAKGRHYRFILKALSTGPKKWTSIHEFLELSEGHVSESVFNDSLAYLVRYGLVARNETDETYTIPDPIVGEFAKGL